MGRWNPWVLSGVMGMLVAGASPAAAQTAGAAPTFSKDIAPIFQAKCQACHQPESIAPIQTLKTEHLGSANPRLHTDEVLIALSVSANRDDNARRALADVNFGHDLLVDRSTRWSGQVGN